MGHDGPVIEDEAARAPGTRRWWILGGSAVVLLALVGAGLWWFLHDDAPDRVDLDAAVENLGTDGQSEPSGEPVFTAYPAFMPAIPACTTPRCVSYR